MINMLKGIIKKPLPKITLHRVASTDKGTFGVLVRDGIPLCVTCEDPDNNNAKNISCIPKGIYRCKPFSGTRFKNVWEITKVPNRTTVLIHEGNTINNTEGCILVGEGFTTMKGLPAVFNSVATLNRLRRTLPSEFELEII